jgi:heme-degrading monooxygenase HmoA
MHFVRVSLLVSTAAHAEEISRIQKELVSYFAAKEGFVDGYYLEAADESRVVGRITVWESAEHAARAANDDHVMAQRSTLLLLMEHQIAAQGFHATRIAKA